MAELQQQVLEATSDIQKNQLQDKTKTVHEEISEADVEVERCRVNYERRRSGYNAVRIAREMIRKKGDIS